MNLRWRFNSYVIENGNEVSDIQRNLLRISGITKWTVMSTFHCINEPVFRQKRHFLLFTQCLNTFPDMIQNKNLSVADSFEIIYI